ncbi:hypothetical protein SNOG_05306 [Parastagonospora nodorum SN15]|uniref:Uncharacterized protein n=1 Tax=Phaeosphaeria nodorum (strain SN15 / ATCC MYA-4574 / FGSC 10173) TaxID=321614 RepID=Q0USF8_PHANO|nr:hypothetical protein SNOG_05306 [Parastagonospora nodorum SN15]EAT87697.2 hypothetical protein SNOG_05306 [Parastagonospora nodorum SN15]
MPQNQSSTSKHHNRPTTKTYQRGHRLLNYIADDRPLHQHHQRPRLDHKTHPSLPRHPNLQWHHWTFLHHVKRSPKIPSLLLRATQVLQVVHNVNNVELGVGLYHARSTQDQDEQRECGSWHRRVQQAEGQ